MKKWKEKPIWLSIILNIVILACLMLLFRPNFETSDDAYMNEFASGIFGQRENHLVFINYILGSIIRFLYEILPIVNWYTIAQYAAVFASFTSITYVLVRTKGTELGIGVSAILITAFGYQCYVLPQFTKTAGCLLVAGAVLIFAAFQGEKAVWKQVVMGVFLMLWGAMYREIVFYLCLLMVFPIGMVIFFRDFFKNSYQCVAKYVIIIMIFVGVLGCVQVTSWYHECQYAREPEWTEYLEWDRALVKLIDSFFPYYQDDIALYTDLGISESDLRYYENWNVADTDKLSTESLKRLGVAKDAYWISTKTKLIEFWSEFPGVFLQVTVFPYSMILLAFLLLNSSKWNWMAYFLEAGALFAAYMYMYIGGRYMQNRVDVVVWFGAIVSMLYMWEPDGSNRLLNAKNKRNLLVSLQVCTMLLLGCINSESFRWKYNPSVEENILTRQDAIVKDKEHLYLCTINVFGTGVTVDPFYVGEESELSNFYLLGSWTVNTPITNHVLREYGIENPYRDAIDNEKVFILDSNNNIELLRYIRENYNECAQLKAVSEIGNYTVYSVVTE